MVGSPVKKGMVQLRVVWISSSVHDASFPESSRPRE
jgi:hypothetical protein